jgi:RNA polymerase sigma-70 factor (ECF subfamily)
MDRARKADEEARFLELYRSTLAPLRKYAARTLGDAVRADDIVQECFVRALASANFPSDHRQARAYLFRIASNLVIDHWRAERRERGSELDRNLASAVDYPDLRMDLADTFLLLTLRERQLIWLAHVEGLDHGDIAAMLGIGAASVKVLLHRARGKFAGVLRRSGYDDR